MQFCLWATSRHQGGGETLAYSIHLLITTNSVRNPQKVLSAVDDLYCAFVFVGHDWHQEGEEILRSSIHHKSASNPP